MERRPAREGSENAVGQVAGGGGIGGGGGGEGAFGGLDGGGGGGTTGACDGMDGGGGGAPMGGLVGLEGDTGLLTYAYCYIGDVSARQPGSYSCEHSNVTVSDIGSAQELSDIQGVHGKIKSDQTEIVGRDPVRPLRKHHIKPPSQTPHAFCVNALVD